MNLATHTALYRFAGIATAPAIAEGPFELSAALVSAALVAEERTHSDVSRVMNELAACVALSPVQGLAMAAEAFKDACLELVGKLPASSKELQGRGEDKVAAKVFGRLRSRFNRRGIDFSAAKGELVAKLMNAAKPGKAEAGDKGETSDDKGETGGETGLTLAPTLEQCAAIVSAASKTDASELAALLVKCGFDFGAVASAALALEPVALANAA